MKHCSNVLNKKEGMQKSICIFALILIVAFMLTGCREIKASVEPDETEVRGGYTHLSPEDALAFVESAEQENAIIMDVRGELAYQHGHVPGAIYTNADDYQNGRVPELPDLDQKILVYCDFGGLSQEVAEKLVEQGYTNVFEFKGMDVWPGEVIEEEGAKL